MPSGIAEMERLERKSEDVARILRAMSNPRRLLILCKLSESGAMSVGRLTEVIGISQSALSQHLAVMRDEQLVAFDRDGQTLNYRIADERLEALLTQLYEIYCAPDEGGKE